MRERFDDRRMNSEHWVEQVCQADSVCFRNQTEECPISIEAPGPAMLDDFKARFVMPVKQLVGNFPGRVFVS